MPYSGGQAPQCLIDRVSDEIPSESVPDNIAGAGSEPSPSEDPSEDSRSGGQSGSSDVQDDKPEDVDEVNNLCVLGERP
jgi:hypothetical protein